MPQIRAFQGLRYNDQKIKKLANVYAPPYDVISPKEQQALHDKNPFNVIRLELGKEKSGDSAKNNKYTRAKEALQSWKKESVLMKEDVPSLYVYVQDYHEEGRNKTRLGFLAAMKIDESSVLKHENTLAGPKQDRMALLKEVRTNLSPIFGLFEDAKADIKKILSPTIKAQADIDVTVDNVRHRIYVEKNPAVLRKVEETMKHKPMFIADGHHRFEVSCQFKRWAKAKNANAASNYVMTYFADVDHNPFKIFPTHRLIRTPKSTAQALELLATRGKLEKVANIDAVLRRLDQNRLESREAAYPFGIYTAKEGFYIFTLDRKWTDSLKKDPVKQLDVAVLHEQIIAPLFKIKKIAKSKEIDFTRDAKVAHDKVAGREFDMAFFLRPTSLKEMIDVSKKGLKMPQKSTYFYPKLLTGLVFHELTS
jgi:uncharacterized protein (DUF1015 family)